MQAAGYGALKVISRTTGIARSTINRGEDDLAEGPLPDSRVRRKGGGKPLSAIDPTLVDDLRRLGEPATLARRCSRCSGCRRAAEAGGALREMGHKISANTV